MEIGDAVQETRAKPCEAVQSRGQSWKVVESRANSPNSGATGEISAWKGIHGARVLCGIYEHLRFFLNSKGKNLGHSGQEGLVYIYIYISIFLLKSGPFRP